MSVDLVNMSWDISCISSSEKLVLVRLSWHAHHKTFECFPSIKSLVRDTCLDKKTVQSCLSSLEQKELIKKTGEMKGRTKRVPVYKVQLNDPKFGSVQKLNDPVFSGNDPKNGSIKRSRFWDMERSLYKDNRKELFSLVPQANQRQRQIIDFLIKNPDLMPTREERRELEELTG